MAVPEFNKFMLPLLRIAGDGAEHSISEVVEILATQLGLSEGDRNEVLPSGRQTRLLNRSSWARAYLTKAGLLQTTGRGTFRLTTRGREVLQENPGEITPRFLARFPEFRQFQTRAEHGNGPDQIEELTQTPQEMLESSHQRLVQQLAADLLERVKSCSARFFETLVVDLLVAMGYGGSRKDAGQAVGQSGDGGIDGIIKEDKLGLDVVYIQAKKWEGTVGRQVVQAFAGSLEGQRARKGVLITTSQFSQEAQDYVGRIEKKIVLIDGQQLAQLMIEHGVGVTEVATFSVRKMDADYFGDEV